MRDRRLRRLFLRFRQRGDVDALTAVFNATAPGLLSLALAPWLTGILVRKARRAKERAGEYWLSRALASGEYTLEVTCAGETRAYPFLVSDGEITDVFLGR